MAGGGDDFMVNKWDGTHREKEEALYCTLLDATAPVVSRASHA